MIVRVATPADVEAVVALGEAVVPHTYGPIDESFAAWQLERWWSADAVRSGFERLPHWVALDGEEVLGVANLGVHDGLPVVWKLYVHPGRHGSGIGTALLGAVEAAAEGRALTLEYLDGNEQAARFYARRGFVATGRSTFEARPHLDWVWMRKELS